MEPHLPHCLTVRLSVIVTAVVPFFKGVASDQWRTPGVAAPGPTIAWCPDESSQYIVHGDAASARSRLRILW
jgi:hypothetical protein